MQRYAITANCKGANFGQKYSGEGGIVVPNLVTWGNISLVIEAPVTLYFYEHKNFDLSSCSVPNTEVLLIYIKSVYDRDDIMNH